MLDPLPVARDSAKASIRVGIKVGLNPFLVEGGLDGLVAVGVVRHEEHVAPGLREGLERLDVPALLPNSGMLPKMTWMRTDSISSCLYTHEARCWTASRVPRTAVSSEYVCILARRARGWRGSGLDAKRVPSPRRARPRPPSGTFPPSRLDSMRSGAQPTPLETTAGSPHASASFTTSPHVSVSEGSTRASARA